MLKYGPPKLASFRYCRIILTGKCQGSCEKNRWAWNCQEIFSVPSTNSQQPRTRCSMSVHKMIPISLSTRNWPRVTIWLHVLAMEPLVDAPPGSSLAQNAQGNFSFPKILEKQMPDCIMNAWSLIVRRDVSEAPLTQNLKKTDCYWEHYVIECPHLNS